MAGITVCNVQESAVCLIICGSQREVTPDRRQRFTAG